MASVPHTSTESSSFDLLAGSEQRPGLYSRGTLKTLQVNIGLRCNLRCRHCHVNSSPKRNERMDWETMSAVLRLADALSVEVLDITGGAPEMHPDFERFVLAAKDRNRSIMVRTNLTILLEEGYTTLPEFYRDNAIHLVASLPCYLEENVDAQRGTGVYTDSIEALQRLNAVGYARDPSLKLDLVYNPGGPVLPPEQTALEDEYRRDLAIRFGISFNDLYTITNVPIGRFRGDLRRDGQLDTYEDLLRDSFNLETVDTLMCRNQISVGWDGTIYDCDFNLALRTPSPELQTNNVRDVQAAELLCRRIATGDHCFACTAGAGSSCGGALVE